MKTLSRSKKLRRGIGASAATLTWALATAALALPTNPTLPFAGGTGATFTTDPVSQTLTVNQSSDRIVIDWDSFNIGSTESVTFVQPTTSSIAFNRIDPSAFTNIDGALSANGSVWLFSPGGIMFGSDAEVDVGSLFVGLGTLDDWTVDDALTTNHISAQPTGLGNLLTVAAGATIKTTDGFLVLQAPNMVVDGALTSSDGVAFIVGDGGHTLFDPSAGDLALQNTGAIWANASPGTISFSHSGHTQGAWIELGTQWDLSSGFDAVINVGGILEATSVRPGGSNLSISLMAGSSAADLASGGSITLQTGGTVLAPGDISIAGHRAVLGGDITSYGGSVQAFAYETLETVGVIDAGGLVQIHVQGDGGVLDIGGQIYAGGNVDIAANSVGASVTVSGLIAADDNVDIRAASSVTIESTADISANVDNTDAAYLSIRSGAGFDLDTSTAFDGAGDLTVYSGAVIDAGQDANVFIGATNGALDVNGTITAGGSVVELWSAGTGAGMVLDGAIESDGWIFARSEGNLVVGEGASLTAHNELGAHAWAIQLSAGWNGNNGDLTIYSGANIFAGLDANTDDILIEANGFVTQDGYIDGYDVVIHGRDGVDISNGVSADGDLAIRAVGINGVVGTGSITIDDPLSAGGDITVQTTSGDITVAPETGIYAGLNGAGSLIQLGSQSGNIYFDGYIGGDQVLIHTGGYGGASIFVDGSIQASEWVEVLAGGADGVIDITGNIDAAGRVLVSSMGTNADVSVTGQIHSDTGILVETHRAGSTTYIDGVLSSAGYVLVNGYEATTIGGSAVIESDTDNNGAGNVLISAGRGYDLDQDCWCVIGSGDVMVSSGAYITGGGSFGVSIWAYNGDVTMSGQIVSDGSVALRTLGATEGDVRLYGDIDAANNVYLYTQINGDVRSIGDITAGGNVEIFASGAGNYTGVYGDVTADGLIRIAAMGDVTIGNSDFGPVSITADANGDGTGESLIITAGLGYDFDAQTWTVEGSGDVRIVGSYGNLQEPPGNGYTAIGSGTYLDGGAGNVRISAHNGDIYIDGGVTSDGNILIETLGANGGDIGLWAFIGAYGDVRIQTTEGNIDILSGSVIASDVNDDGGADLSLVIRAGHQVGGSGSVTVEDSALLIAGGEVSPDRVSIEASNAVDIAGTVAGSRVSVLADGDIDISGGLYGSDLVQVVSGDLTFPENDVDLVGNVTISGTISASDLLNVTSYGGDVTIQSGAVLISDSDGAPTAAVLGEDTRDAVYLQAVDGTVTVESGAIVSAGPTNAPTETLFVYAGAVDLANGSLEFNSLFMEVGSDIYFDAGWVLEGESITLRTLNGGDITVAGEVNADDVTFYATQGGNITVSGDVFAFDDILMASVGNDGPALIDVSGYVRAGGEIVIGPQSAATGIASVSVTGDLLAYDVSVVSGGDLYVGPAGNIELVREFGGGTISLQAGANGAAASLTIAEGATVRGNSETVVDISSSGDAILSGYVRGGAVSVSGVGDVLVGGDLIAFDTADVTAGDDMTVSGLIRADNAVTLTNANGDIYVSGTVIAGADGSASPSGDTLVIRAENGVFTLVEGAALIGGGGEGGLTTDVSIYAGSASIAGEIAFADLLVETSGDLTITGAALYGDSVALATTGGGDISFQGLMDIVQNVSMQAEQGGSIGVDGSIQAGGDVILNSVGNSSSNEESIDVAGSIQAGGSIQIGQFGPDITTGLVNQVNVNAELTAGGVIGIRSGGGVYIGGESVLRADADDNADPNQLTLLVLAGLNQAPGSSADLVVGSGARLYAGGEDTTNGLLLRSTGDVDMGGFASAGGIQLQAYGDISMSGELVSGGLVTVLAQVPDNGEPVGTSVSITGDIRADDSVVVISENGSVFVGEGAVIHGDADGVPTEAPVDLWEGVVINASNGSIVTGEGSLLLAGDADLPTGLVYLYASGMDGEGAAIQLSGDIVAEVVSVESYKGSIVVSGDIWATEAIQMIAYQYFVLTGDGSMRVEGAGDGPANAAPDGSSWPYVDLTDTDISIAAADMEIDGVVSGETIAILAGNVDGDAFLGGEDGALGGDFNLSNEEFQNLHAETILVVAGSDGEETALEGQTNLIVNDLDIDSDVVKTLVLGTGSESYLHIAGTVTPSEAFATDLWIGGVAVSQGDFTTRSFIPGTVVITGSLGSIENPFLNVSLLALGDVLMGSEAFVLAAAEDPEFDAAQESDNYEIDEGHVFIAGYSLRIGANGRIIQQNTGAPGEYAGIWARAPYEGHELIWAPEELEGVEVGGEDGFTLSFSEGPEDVQLFGVFTRENEQGQLEEVSGKDAAQLDHLVDGDIDGPEGWDLNSCEIGGDVCASDSEADEIPRFEDPTELAEVELPSEEEQEEAENSAAAATSSQRRDIFQTLIAPEADRAYQQERMGEPVTGSGNEDLWTGRDVGAKQ